MFALYAKNTAASVDREHDDNDRAVGRRISCPLLALWSARGALNTWYEEAGGPIALWQAWCGGVVQGQTVDAGHFFPRGGAGADRGTPGALFEPT
jgi:haloacetate dehalogenase